MKKMLLLGSLCCISMFSFAQTVNLYTYDANGNLTQSGVTVPFCTTQSFLAIVSLPGGAEETTSCGMVYWDVNGTIYGSPATGGLTQGFSIPITTSSVNVAVTVNMGPPGCSYSTAFTSNTLTITGLAQDIHIDGPLQVCTEPQTFTVRNLPSGTPISWSVTSNLQIISGQNTPTIQVEQVGTGTGTGNVSATVGTVCNYTPPVLNLGVAIGVVEPTSINGFTPGEVFAPNTTFAFSATNGNDWIVNGGTILSGQGTDFIIVQTNSLPNGGSIPFAVEVRQDNSCGVSSYFTDYGMVEAGGTGPHIIVGPNPAAGTVTLSVAPATPDAAQTPASKVAAASFAPATPGTQVTSLPATIRQVKIFDVAGRLRKVLENKAAASSLQLDVSDLTNGIYFIETVVGTTIDRQKLVVQH